MKVAKHRSFKKRYIGGSENFSSTGSPTFNTKPKVGTGLWDLLLYGGPLLVVTLILTKTIKL